MSNLHVHQHSRDACSNLQGSSGLHLTIFSVSVFTAEEISGAAPVKTSSCDNVNDNKLKGTFNLVMGWFSLIVSVKDLRHMILTVSPLTFIS